MNQFIPTGNTDSAEANALHKIVKGLSDIDSDRLEKIATLEHDLAETKKARDEMKEALIWLWNDVGGGKKLCGHDFTCVCAGEKVRQVLSF